MRTKTICHAAFSAALAVLGASHRARACTAGCVVLPHQSPDAEICRRSKRIFAGAVAQYQWPNAYEIGACRMPLGVELVVDKVWRGRVPARLQTTTGLGAGACGIAPPPGTRFLVCDDEAETMGPDFHYCQGIWDDTGEREMGSIAGLAGPPVRRPLLEWPSWLELVWGAFRFAWLWVPMGAATFAALLGHRRAARHLARDSRPSRIALALGILAVGVVGILLGYPVTRVHPSMMSELYQFCVTLAVWGPLVIATLLGMVIGFAGQVRPWLFGGRLRALAIALASPAIVAILGYEISRPPW